jgi:hypothetical protein
MAKTAILNAADMTLAGVANTKAEIAAIVGDTPDAFVLVVKKQFEATEQHPSWEEMCGEVVVVEPTEATEKAPRSPAVALAGPYHFLKPIPPLPADSPRQSFIDAITTSDTVEAAAALCPEKVARAKNGFFTFNTEFRYLMRLNIVALGEAPAA